MPAAVWWGVKFAPGGHGTFFGLLNSFVHVVMYSYYLLAAMGPQFQKYLWWKKHLTTLQMVQFATVFVHSSQALFNGCNYPKILSLALCFHSILFFGLFFNFYIQVKLFILIDVNNIIKIWTFLMNRHTSNVVVYQPSLLKRKKCSLGITNHLKNQPSLQFRRLARILARLLLNSQLVLQLLVSWIKMRFKCISLKTTRVIITLKIRNSCR